MTTAVVFDYGFGNVRSMVRALANLGVDTTLTSDYRQSLEADGLVVPGVGAFAACMEGLKKVDGDRVIYDRHPRWPPGARRVRGRADHVRTRSGARCPCRRHRTDRRFVSNLLDADVVPHMGWDTIEAAPDSVLLNGVENERFYFVHSYAAMEVKPADTSRFDIDLSDSPERVSWCSYGRSRFVAAYEHGPLSATQFHPEKSGDAGSQLLKNWIATL